MSFIGIGIILMVLYYTLMLYLLRDVDPRRLKRGVENE